MFLDQNSPNPARGNTLIRYRIPETSTSAHVSLTNVKGQMLRMLTISNKGVGQINVDTSALPSGTYTYSLHVDGKQVGSKQLVVAR